MTKYDRLKINQQQGAVQVSIKIDQKQRSEAMVMSGLVSGMVQKLKILTYWTCWPERIVISRS